MIEIIFFNHQKVYIQLWIHLSVIEPAHEGAIILTNPGTTGVSTISDRYKNYLLPKEV